MMLKMRKKLLCLIDLYSESNDFLSLSYKLFKKKSFLLKDTNLVIADKSGFPIFDDIKSKIINKNIFLHSNFICDNLVVLNTKSVKNTISFKIDRNINLDTQIVSYIARDYDCKSTPLELEKMIKIFHASGISYTPLPYLFENCLFKDISPSVVQTIKKFERVFWKDIKPVDECDEYADNLINEFEIFKLSSYADDVKKLYKQIYLSLLIMYVVNTDENIKKEHKFDEFTKIFIEEIKFVLIPEFNIADLFFKKQYSLKLFGKLQSSKDIITEIENIAWDIYHLIFPNVFPISKGENFITAEMLMTMDKGLHVISENCLLKGVLYSKYSTKKLYYIKNFNEEKLVCHLLSNPRSSRIEEAKKVNYDELIAKYEKIVKDKNE